MSNTKNTGGPAFPSEYDVELSYPHNPEEKYWTKMKAPGMTLRDYFAIRATEADIKSVIENGPGEWYDREGAKYIYADRMLKAREQ